MKYLAKKILGKDYDEITDIFVSVAYTAITVMSTVILILFISSRL